MHEITKTILISGALLALVAVLLGAFGAHALKKTLTTDMLAIYQTAVHYHFIHALGLLLIGILHQQYPQSGWLLASATVMLAGILLFSGSLYALSLTGISKLGMITPVGGLLFIAAWALLAFGVYKT